MSSVSLFSLGVLSGFTLPVMVLYLWWVVPRFIRIRREGLMPGLSLTQIRARIAGVILRGSRADLLLDALAALKSRGAPPPIDDLEIFYLLNRCSVKTPGDLVALADRSGFTSERSSRP
jgi:hypothetical protein